MSGTKTMPPDVADAASDERLQTAGGASSGPRHWIAVASADHVAHGRTLGIVQVCHGKAAPLRRLAPGDRVICYSSLSHFGGQERLQAFTAIGTVGDGAPYQVEMTPGFRPWRRAVHWEPAREAPIRPLLGRLTFTGVGRNWGYRFRFGLFEIPGVDAALIATAMLGGEDVGAPRTDHHAHCSMILPA